MANIEVKKARNGKGIFAKKALKKGVTIFELKGTLISCDVDDDLDEETRSNTIRFDENLYLNPKGEMGVYLNHSCAPNSFLVKKSKKLSVVAVKEIANREEITIDYSTTIARDDIWEMRCNCGSSKCRRVIGQFKKLPKETQKKYISLDMVPKYIR